MMPIKISDSLPARAVLESEKIFVMTEYRAFHQDIRPLKVLILNLMPTKVVTEIQLMRKLSNTPLQIDVDLLYTLSHSSKHTSVEYLSSFYKTFDQVRDQRYDGMIITGAPVENLDFQDVEYWEELCEIMEWTKTHVYNTLHICWGAQAGLYYHYHIEKHQLPKKLFGVFQHTPLDAATPLFRGFDDKFYAPHSRYTEVYASDIRKNDDLQLLATSDEAGVFAVQSTDNRQIFIFGHPEYDANTLASEYWRDVKKGLDIDVPAHYYPHNDPSNDPFVSWRAHGQLLYSNWLNYYVYQTTPYDLRDLEH
jgi:homoserine O-succinyltransferase